MKKFEYQLVSYPTIEDLNLLGAEGWELPILKNPVNTYGTSLDGDYLLRRETTCCACLVEPLDV